MNPKDEIIHDGVIAFQQWLLDRYGFTVPPEEMAPYTIGCWALLDHQWDLAWKEACQHKVTEAGTPCRN